MEMPAPVKRTAAPLANLLCDTSSYVLGVSNKDAPERCRSCRAKFCEAHRRLLEGVGSPAARAVLSFVESWDPASKECEELLAMADEGAVTGSTIALAYLDQGGEVARRSAGRPSTTGEKTAWSAWCQADGSPRPGYTPPCAAPWGPCRPARQS